MYNVQFTVVRGGEDGERARANISAMVRHHELTFEQMFLKALTDATTEWVKTTDEGNEAWQRASHDFNIGDLALELDVAPGAARLIEILNQQGISNMSVEIGEDQCNNWMFDTVLVNELELEEKHA